MTALDVFVSGTVFFDEIFTGLSEPPPPGTEFLTSGLGTAPGGIANLAVALSRLGLKTGLAAAFSDDMYGSYLWRTLAEQERVDLSESRRVPGWPTPVTVSLSDGRDRRMITYRERPPLDPAWQLSSPPPVRACFSHIGNPPPPWVAKARADGATVFADVGWDPTGAWSADVLDRLEMVDVFTPNAVEAMAYTRTATPAAALDALAGRVPLCVVKMGRDGAIGSDSRTGDRATAAALPVAALDPTGAGDVFNAAVIFGTLAGWPLAQRLRFANLCAGLSVRHHSGSLGAPGWAEIAGWAQNHDEYAFILPHIPAAATGPVVRAFPTVRT